jgi:hypothetical protein
LLTTFSALGELRPCVLTDHFRLRSALLGFKAIWIARRAVINGGGITLEVKVTGEPIKDENVAATRYKAQFNSATDAAPVLRKG